MDAEQVRRELWRQLNPINESTLGSVFLAPRAVMIDFVDESAEAIARMADEPKSEPPEPPKTVLPDMSGAERDIYHWFFAEDGTQVSCFISLDGETQWGIDDNWYKPDSFIKTFPHLGRLRRAVPGEVAE